MNNFVAAKIIANCDLFHPHWFLAQAHRREAEQAFNAKGIAIPNQ